MIAAILFDADGVVQSPRARWRAAIGSRLGIGGTALDVLTREIMALETKHLDRLDGFPEELELLLRAGGYDAPVATLTGIFNAIDTNPDVLALVQRLRAAGTPCYLATNQQAHRADHMASRLGYAAAFDGAFYSCRLGAAKPHRAFFDRILSHLALPAGSLLLVDDRAENLRGAEAAGLATCLFDEAEGAIVLAQRLAALGLVPSP